MVIPIEKLMSHTVRLVENLAEWQITRKRRLFSRFDRCFFLVLGIIAVFTLIGQAAHPSEAATPAAPVPVTQSALPQQAHSPLRGGGRGGVTAPPPGSCQGTTVLGQCLPVTLPQAPSLLPNAEDIRKTAWNIVAQPTHELLAQESSDIDNRTSIFVVTDPYLTVANQTVYDYWKFMLTAVDLWLVAIFVFACWNLLIGIVEMRYVDAIEVLPRLILAFLGAHFSILFAGFCIAVSNTLLLSFYDWAHPATFQETINHLLYSDTTWKYGSVLYLVLDVIICIWYIEAYMYIGLLVVLIVFSPVCFMGWALTQTQELTFNWIRMFVLALCTHVVQFFVYVLGSSVLEHVIAYDGTGHIHQTGSNAQMSILAIISIYYTILQIPSLIKAQFGSSTSSRALIQAVLRLAR